MKTQLPQALRTGRVKERLVALGNHVQDAIELTRLDPVKTSEPELSGESIPDLPEVTGIQPDEIAYADREKFASNGLTVSGSNLQNVQKVRLILRGEVGGYAASGVISNLSTNGDSFTANIADLKNAPAGDYNLLLIDNIGQTAPFYDVLTILSPEAASSQPAGQPTEYGIESVIPPGGHAGQHLSLWVIGEKGSFTTGTTFKFDNPEELTASLKVLHSDDVAVLEVTISDNATPRTHTLTAITGTQQATAQFHVHKHHRDWIDFIKGWNWASRA